MVSRLDGSAAGVSAEWDRILNYCNTSEEYGLKENIILFIGHVMLSLMPSLSIYAFSPPAGAFVTLALYEVFKRNLTKI